MVNIISVQLMALSRKLRSKDSSSILAMAWPISTTMMWHCWSWIRNTEIRQQGETCMSVCLGGVPKPGKRPWERGWHRWVASMFRPRWSKENRSMAIPDVPKHIQPICDAPGFRYGRCFLVLFANYWPLMLGLKKSRIVWISAVSPREKRRLKFRQNPGLYNLLNV